MLRKIEKYEVSPSGFVKNTHTGRVLKNSKDVRGYAVVNLSLSSGKKKEYVHRLVAQAYLPNPKNKPQIAHIDGNKMDANIFNIRWATAAENDKDKDMHGTRVIPSTYSIKEIRSHKYKHGLFTQLAKDYGVSRHAIARVYKRESWSSVA